MPTRKQMKFGAGAIVGTIMVAVAVVLLVQGAKDLTWLMGLWD